MKYSPFRHLPAIVWKKRAIQLTLFLTARCNGRCPFCFYLSGKKQADPADELSLGEIQKISSSLGSLLWLAFSGGEIFLRDDLVEISQTFYQQNKPAIILLPTNGLLTEKIFQATEEILKTCPKSVVTVKLSVDGPETLHNNLRRVPDAFNRTMATYEKLSSLLGTYPNFELGINTVFCAANQERMAETIDIIGSLPELKTHTISMIRGKAAASDRQKIDMAKYHEAIRLLQTNMRKSRSLRYRFIGGRLKAAQDILQRRLIYNTATSNKRQLSCQAGRLTAVITETGDVYPCESFADRLGNIRDCDYNLGRILKTKNNTKKIFAINENKCFCTHECYMMMNILFNPRQYPALLREYLTS